MPNLSAIGQNMSKLTGVRAIMKDISDTLAAHKDKKFINLSPGNPVIIPEIEELWRKYTKQLLDSQDFGEVVGRYGSSRGYQPFIDSIIQDFNTRYGLNLTSKNILVTPGSQSLYFFATNTFGGYGEHGNLKKVVLPMSPEYTGYGSLCLTPEATVSFKPEIEIFEEKHRFKYHPDFSKIVIDKSTGCVILSRPCNPTGNILSEDEVKRITDLAEKYDVPVFIDSAYGTPYPALNFVEMKPSFGKNIVHCITLAKAGLPGERIGVAIGDEDIISSMEAFLTNSNIHSSRYGQAIAAMSINSGELARLSESVIKPFYKNKLALLENTLDESLPNQIPWYLHQGEGAIFAWLWLKDLPISDWELYEKLKEKGVIVVPGSTFFPGLNMEWQHKQECIRLSLTATDEELEEGLTILCETIQEIYKVNRQL